MKAKNYFNSLQIMTKKEDIISLLPDCLLLEIISRLELSTKQVIKTTSTISKRWQHLWTKLPTLSFTCNDYVVPKERYYDYDLSDYFSFIEKTLTKCPTDLNLNKLELIIINNSQVTDPKSQVYSWIQHAITRNVQEVDLTFDTISLKKFSYDHELLFNNSCIMSIKLSGCALNPPNGAIRWDKLKCICIDNGKLDEEVMGKIFSGSPCLETLELDDCEFEGYLSKSVFGNFSVGRLSSYMNICKGIINGHGWFWDVSMKVSRCVSNPSNGWGNLNFLCIEYSKLDEYSMGKILSESPCLETLELYCCYGVRRIDVASNSVKNLEFSDYGYTKAGYMDTLEINAPHILSLTIKGTLDLEKILLLNISSLVKAELDYEVAERLGRTVKDTEDNLLNGLLANLGHVNKITLRNDCLKVSLRLKKRGFHWVHLIIILLFCFLLTGILAY